MTINFFLINPKRTIRQTTTFIISIFILVSCIPPQHQIIFVEPTKIVPTITTMQFATELPEIITQTVEIQNPFVSTISEAIVTNKFNITREQILSGELIQEAKKREESYFSDNVIPEKVILHSFDQDKVIMVFFPSFDFVLQNPNLSPCKIVAVYTLPVSSFPDNNTRQAYLIQAWKTEEGIRYLTYLVSLGNNDYKELEKQLIMTPFYESYKSYESKNDYNNISDDETPIEFLWIKHLDKIQDLIVEWDETGIIPLELSYFPLQPVIFGLYEVNE